MHLAVKTYSQLLYNVLNFIMLPGKGRLQGDDEGARRPPRPPAPRPNSGLGRKGGENAMFELGLGIQGDIICWHRH